MERIKNFGIRFFYNVEAFNHGKGKPVLAELQGTPGEGRLDERGVIENPEKVEQMRIIYLRSNPLAIKEVQTSREFYQKLGNLR